MACWDGFDGGLAPALGYYSFPFKVSRHGTCSGDDGVVAGFIDCSGD